MLHTTIHRRVFPYPASAVRFWIERVWSGSAEDIFPQDFLRTWRRNTGPAELVPGLTVLGHGPFRFHLKAWDGWQWRVEYEGNGTAGWHTFDLVERPDGTELVHTLEVDLGRTRWGLAPMAIPAHDWVMEAMYDRLEVALATGKVPTRTTRRMPPHIWLFHKIIHAWQRLHDLGLNPMRDFVPIRPPPSTEEARALTDRDVDPPDEPPTFSGGAGDPPTEDRPTVVVRPRITMRRRSFEVPDNVPRHWLGGRAVRSHILNAMAMFLPETERFVARAARRQLPAVTDAALARDLRGFIFQEAQHGREHHKLLAILRDQGYSIDGYLRLVRVVLSRFVEALPDRAVFATVAAGEHLTGLAGDVILSDGFLDDADPRMRALFEWHFAEEVEHKAVAFEVLEATWPGLGARLVGLGVSHAVIPSMVALGTLWLLYEDGLLGKARTWGELAEFFVTREKFALRMVAGVVEFVLPAFHPTAWDEAPAWG